MSAAFWEQECGGGPLVATAIHHGHDLREEVAALLAISEADRLREEDPFTGAWTRVAATRIVIQRSRFEVDLNRPRQRAAYRTPEDAWGLRIWRSDPPAEVLERSRTLHDDFYTAMHELFARLVRSQGRFVIFDLHSYNHRRGGPSAPPADTAGNPQVNIGTGTLDRTIWAPVVDRFIRDLRSYSFPGGQLDVRENVKFQGGFFPRWIHEKFPTTGCGLAIEFKKFFMDEWSGEPDPLLLQAIGDALQSTVPGVLTELRHL